MLKRAVCLSRREALSLIGKASVAGVGLVYLNGCRRPDPASHGMLLDSLQRATCAFFWEQASPITGLIRDRAATRGADGRTLSSIASTGFGLTSLCIADSHGYQPRSQIKQRVVATLSFLQTQAPVVNGFFYHFMDMNTGARAGAGGFLRSTTPSFSAEC